MAPSREALKQIARVLAEIERERALSKARTTLSLSYADLGVLELALRGSLEGAADLRDHDRIAIENMRERVREARRRVIQKGRRNSE